MMERRKLASFEQSIIPGLEHKKMKIIQRIFYTENIHLYNGHAT